MILAVEVVGIALLVLLSFCYCCPQAKMLSKLLSLQHIERFKISKNLDAKKGKIVLKNVKIIKEKISLSIKYFSKYLLAKGTVGIKSNIFIFYLTNSTANNSTYYLTLPIMRPS